MPTVLNVTLLAHSMVFYNPDKVLHEPAKPKQEPMCPYCRIKIPYEFSHTPTYMGPNPRILKRTRTCRNCGFSSKDSRPVLLNEWESLTIDLLYCPICKGQFDTEITELDFVRPDPPPFKGRKRVLILNGRCQCGFVADKIELVVEPTNTSSPTTHVQKSPRCNQEYWLDWTQTERTYL
jgi:C4-type Zn-finger protein